MAVFTKSPMVLKNRNLPRTISLGPATLFAKKQGARAMRLTTETKRNTRKDNAEKYPILRTSSILIMFCIASSRFWAFKLGLKAKAQNSRGDQSKEQFNI